ncbi:hypothetical protein HAX54_016171 [Datura stramonium]|uniref:Uncharacterized protein n=1 Tax=Datura stramonium TaxID=4076 RepID=A0ABS8UIG6_DATST|nr:hypothetical protein [Datura stramonium]
MENHFQSSRVVWKVGEEFTLTHLLFVLPYSVQEGMHLNGIHLWVYPLFIKSRNFIHGYKIQNSSTADRQSWMQFPTDLDGKQKTMTKTLKELLRKRAQARKMQGPDACHYELSSRIISKMRRPILPHPLRVLAENGVSGALPLFMGCPRYLLHVIS